MQFFSALKSARKIEWLLLVAAAAILLVLVIGNTGKEADEPNQQLARFLSEIEGAGKVQVLLNTDESGVCSGAVIATRAAQDISVVLQLQHAVRALTGLELEQIEIVKSGR